MTVNIDKGGAIEAPQDLPYRLKWRVAGLKPGAHKGAIPGSGGLFRDVVPLIEAPDPRRIDVRASVRDPYGALMVRRFEQQSAATIYALVDLSASMGFVGAGDRMALAALLVGALASSARRIGDAFGLMGCDDAIRPEFDIAATASRASEQAMVSALAAFEPTARAGSSALLEAADRLSGRRKLIVLISDFRFDEPFIADLFDRLAAHDVVPIVLDDTREREELPDWRLIPFQDVETGRGRLFLMRPSLKDKWRRAEQARRADLEARVMSVFGTQPYVVTSRIDWTDFGDYLMTGRA